MGPLPDTVLTFWRMAWDTGSNSFIMVTLVEEGGKVKCEPYWPQVRRRQSPLPVLFRYGVLT